MVGADANSISIEKDINDAFDEILFSEEKQIESAYEEGRLRGSSEGNPEGYHLGYHRGSELGAELGYYYSIAESYLSRNPAEKVKTNLCNLLRLIDEFPCINDESCDILKLADDIRTLYKKVCALLKIDAVYPELDNLSF